MGACYVPLKNESKQVERRRIMPKLYYGRLWADKCPRHLVRWDCQENRDGWLENELTRQLVRRRRLLRKNKQETNEPSRASEAPKVH